MASQEIEVDLVWSEVVTPEAIQRCQGCSKPMLTEYQLLMMIGKDVVGRIPFCNSCRWGKAQISLGFSQRNL